MFNSSYVRLESAEAIKKYKTTSASWNNPDDKNVKTDNFAYNKHTTNTAHDDYIHIEMTRYLTNLL